MTTPTFIQAVPWIPERAVSAKHLADQVGGIIVWDSEHNAFQTWRDVLVAASYVPSGSIILEDDVILTDNWRDKIEPVIAEHSEAVIQFFSMRGDDLTVGSRWEPGRTFLMNQCYYLPPGVAQHLLDYTADWVTRHPDHPTGYDMAMAEWMKVNSMRYWLHVPSLVQHRPWRSEINPRRPRNRQSRTFA